MRQRGMSAVSEQMEVRVLPAATLTRFDSPEGSSAYTNEFVRMNLGDFIVDFDTRFGATPSRWFYNGVPVTDPFPGTGVTVMWDQGNDPTQASSSGLAPNPVARLDGLQLENNYYTRETHFGAGTAPGSVEYTVAGFAPFFWISAEAADDSMPSESRPRWLTAYSQEPANPLVTTDPSLPVYYVASGAPDGAVLMIGDDFVNSALPWYQRMAEMREGRLAAKVRVSLREASSDAIASLMFRRSVPTSGNVTEEMAFNAAGYSLDVNRAGDIAITRKAFQGAPSTTVWSSPGIAASTINTINGALLEIRTHNGNANVEIYLNNQKIGDYSDPEVIRGPHFGLFATSTTGRIKFSDRQVFDVGTEFVARYTGFENGVLESDIEIRNAAGVSSPNQLYFGQMPIAWLHSSQQGAAVARAYDAVGNVQQEFSQGAVSWAVLRGENPDPAKPEPYALWLGSTTTNAGLFAVPKEAWVNGLPATHPQAQIDVNNQGRYALQLNALPPVPFPPSSQSQRVPVSSARMVTNWRPRLESVTPLTVSVSDAQVTEGNSGTTQMTFQVSLNRRPTQLVSVSYATAGQTAIAGSDFSQVSGTLTFDPADGQLTKSVAVNILSDTVYESAETLRLILSGAVHSGLGDAIGDGTIGNDDALGIPTLTMPGSATDAMRPVVGWTRVSGASSYEVTIDNLSTGGTRIYHRTVSGTELTLGFDLGIGKFRTRVRAIAANGDTSLWSAARDFRVTTPAVLSPLTPRQSTLRPTMAWSALSGAVQYEIWMSNVSTGQSQFLRRSGLTGLTFTPDADLPLGRYRVWVRGADAGGTFARWSNSQTFVVAAAPSVTAPLNATFDRTPLIRWTSLPGVSTYRVQIRDRTSGVVVTDVSGISSVFCTPTAPLADGTYRIFVSGFTEDGIGSFWSPASELFIGGRPTLLGPSGAISVTRPEFSWTAVELADSYELKVNRVSAPGATVVSVAGLKSVSWTAVTSLTAGTYRAWIRAVSVTGETSVWSLARDFTIAAVVVPEEPSALLTSELLPTLNQIERNARAPRAPVAQMDSGRTVPVQNDEFHSMVGQPAARHMFPRNARSFGDPQAENAAKIIISLLPVHAQAPPFEA